MGLTLTSIYSNYYTDRATADVFKYYDDSKYMYDALKSNPLDYAKMLTGIGNNTPHFDRYYNKMFNWKRQFENQVYNDHQTMIRLNAFFRLFSFGYYPVHTILMSFLSLLGLMGIFKSLAPFFGEKKKLLVATIFLVPSVLFWGSPVLKEGILFFGAGMLFYAVMQMISGVVVRKKFILLAVGIIVLIFIKIYVLFALLPALLTFFIVRKFNFKRPLIAYSVMGLVGLGALAISGQSNSQYNIVKTIVQKQTDFIGLANGGVYMTKGEICIYIPDSSRCLINKTDNKHYTINQGASYASWNIYNVSDTVYVKNSTDTASYTVRSDLQPSGSKFDVTKLHPSLLSMIKNIPEALMNAVFRPLPFGTHNKLELLSALENTGILLFILLTIIFSTPMSRENRNLFWMLMSYSFVMSLLIGWVTPVSGALVRYKVPIYPFILPALLLLLNTDKIPNKWKKLLVSQEPPQELGSAQR